MHSICHTKIKCIRALWVLRFALTPMNPDTQLNEPFCYSDKMYQKNFKTVYLLTSFLNYTPLSPLISDK